MSLPKTCKAVKIAKVGGDFSIEDVEVRSPGEGEIVVKVSHCGVCSSDHHVQQGKRGCVRCPFSETRVNRDYTGHFGPMVNDRTDACGWTCADGYCCCFRSSTLSLRDTSSSGRSATFRVNDSLYSRKSD